MLFGYELGKFGQKKKERKKRKKNNTNNFDLLYFNLKSGHLTSTKHICSQENLRNNIFLTYFNSCTGIKGHSC